MSGALFNLLMNIITLYTFIVFAWVVVSWLQALGIVNIRNPLMYNIVRGLGALVEPVIRPIQRILPSFAGLDFSPIILLLGLYFIRDLIKNIYRSGSLL